MKIWTEEMIAENTRLGAQYFEHPVCVKCRAPIDRTQDVLQHGGVRCDRCGLVMMFEFADGSADDEEKRAFNTHKVWTNYASLVAMHDHPDWFNGWGKKEAKE